MSNKIIDKISNFQSITIEDIRNLKTIENLNEVQYFVNSMIKLTDNERIGDMNEKAGHSQGDFVEKLKYYRSIIKLIDVVMKELEERSISNLSTSLSLLTMREPTPQQEKNLLRKLGDYLTGEDRLPKIKLRLLHEHMDKINLPDDIRSKIRDMVIERFRRKGVTVRRVDLPSRTVRQSSLNRSSVGSKKIKTKRKGKNKRKKTKKKTHKKK